MINNKAIVDLVQKILKGQSVIGDDIKEIKSDVKTLKSDVILLRSDVDNLNDEVIDLKNGVKVVKKTVDDTNERIDLIGKQLANLDEDAPSGEDFTNLENRVTKLEQNIVFA